MKSKKTILVVEDEEPILLALQRILELSGQYEVITAGDGEQGLEALKRVVPDLIISDISMPNMNGLDFCKRVRENPITESTPFIFLTAKKEKMVEGISAGGDDFLLKPFSVDEVLVKIEAIFRRVAKSKIQALQHKGLIEDIPVDNILELCLKESISGELILQSEGKVGLVRLANGDILGVEMEDARDDAALDILRLWKKGTFVIRPSEIKIGRDIHTHHTEVDLSKAIEISDNIWWVGAALPENQGQKNSYLAVYKTNRQPIHLLVDPGSPIHLNEITRKTGQVIGDASRINLYLLSAGSADVALNSMFVRKMNPRAICITSREAWRQQARHYEIPEESVKKIDLSDNYKLKLASGNRLVMLPASFSPEPGAFMTYDQEHRVLFSGNLFSSHAPAEGAAPDYLYAVEGDWNGMLRFHLDRFPSATVIHSLLELIASLEPAPRVIAPRYGRLIREEQISYFVERLASMDWGYNSRKAYLSREDRLVVQAANNVLEQVQDEMALDEAIAKLQSDDYMAGHVLFKGTQIERLLCEGAVFYPPFIRILSQDLSEAAANKIKTTALKAAYNLGLQL
ncbi:MAG TPA: response regulator, partial [Caldithrix abyssi]|nr:response regulator [Caldithrix abyssi]